MIELFSALAVFIGLLCLLPMALRRLKRRKRGRLAGAAMTIGFAFSALFEPAKAEAMVEIDRQKRRRADQHESESDNRGVPISTDDGSAGRL